MNKVKFLFASLALMVSTISVAQDLQTGYFSDTFLYRHDLNPAYGNEKGYFSMPFLGNVNVGMRGNLGIKDILYRVDGKTVLFLNPNVSADEVSKNIPDKGKVVANGKLQIMSAGFNSFGGYSTLELNTRVNAGLLVPGALLKAVKEGLTNEEYDFANTGATMNAYVEAVVGHSRQVNENLRIGAKAKMLFSLGNIDVNLKKATLSLGEDKYTAVVDAEVDANIKNLEFGTRTNKDTGHKYFDGDLEDGKIGLSGWGLAVDLGAVYTMDDFEFSAALQDVGFITYGKNFSASTQGEKTFDTDKYIFSADSESPNSFSNEWKTLKNDLADLYQMDVLGNTGGRVKALGATMNLGAKYRLPMYDKVSVGFTNTTRFQGKYSWTDFRLGANYRPISCLSLSANLSAGTFGVGFGWMLDFQTKKGFDLFVGMDHTPGQFSKQMIPLSSNAQFSFGMNFPL